jgi:hypothetical protein
MWPEMARRRPSRADAYTAAAAHDTTLVDAAAAYRGPYATELGMLTTCPIHQWDAPNLSIVGGAAAVCFTTGQVWDEGEVLRAAR